MMAFRVREHAICHGVYVEMLRREDGIDAALMAMPQQASAQAGRLEMAGSRWLWHARRRRAAASQPSAVSVLQSRQAEMFMI